MGGTFSEWGTQIKVNLWPILTIGSLVDHGSIPQNLHGFSLSELQSALVQAKHVDGLAIFFGGFHKWGSPRMGGLSWENQFE